MLDMIEDRRRFLKSTIALSAMAAAGCSTLDQSRPDARNVHLPGSGIDAVLDRATSSGDVPGLVAAVINSGATIYTGARGTRGLSDPLPMGMDTVMFMASMTKPITSVAAMQLVEQGRLGLDVPAATVIPALGAIKVLPAGNRMDNPGYASQSDLSP